MLARLIRNIYAPIAALALWAVLLALSPDVAKAQVIEDQTKDAQGTEHVVVVPGDSLWSISEERLPPNATPQQVAIGVERIYALNRDRIGSDPDLIFPGQRLLLPPVPAGKPSTAETARTRSTGSTAKGETDRTSRTTATEASAEAKGTAGNAPDPVADPATLPDVAAAPSIPALRSPTVNDSPRSPVASFQKSVRSGVAAATSALGKFFAEVLADGRRPLGWGLLLIAFGALLGLAVLSAWWVLQGWWMRSGVTSKRQERLWWEEVRKEKPFYSIPPVPTVPLEGFDNQTKPAAENHLSHLGSFAAARSKRARIHRGRTPVRRRPSRGRLATGVYSPQILRPLRQARMTHPWSVQRRKVRSQTVALNVLQAQGPQGGR